MTLDENIRVALQDVVRPAGRLVAEPGAPIVLLREGRRRVRRRRVLTGSGAVAVVAAVGVIVGATGLINPSNSGSKPAPELTKPAHSAVQGVLLGVDHDNRLVVTDLAHPDKTKVRQLSGRGSATLATNPAGGGVLWAPPGRVGPSQLALVNGDGKISAFGPSIPADNIVSSLAVSPDGTRVAIAVMSASGTEPAAVSVLPMPGHTGTSRRWTTGSNNVNEISSLSWAPDGRQLTYVPGMETGAGIAASPVTLDTAVPGLVTPTTPAYDLGKCAAHAATWLGISGRFAIVRECNGANQRSGPQLVEIDPGKGAGRGPSTPLQGAGCASTQLSSSPDGSRVLVSECGGVSLVTGGRRLALPGNLLSAVWAGTGVPTPGTVLGAAGAPCPAAGFTLPAPDASWHLRSTGANYSTLPVGGGAVVAVGPNGQTVSLFRGVDQNDFAVSVYSHGAARLVPIVVLGSVENVYPAEVTGAWGPRIPFTTGEDPVSHPCDRWEFQTTGVSIPNLLVYVQAIEPVATRTSAACPGTALAPITSSDGFGKSQHALVFVFTNLSKSACTISGYPRLSLLSPDQVPVPVKTLHGSSLYRDPGPTSINVPPSGRVSFGVTLELDPSQKCDQRSLIGVSPGQQSVMRVTLPGQRPFTQPVAIPTCPGSEMTITALVAGNSGPPRA